MNKDIMDDVEKAFDKWYIDLCYKIPLAIYQNKDLLFCAFMAGIIYDAKDTNSKLSPLVEEILSVKPS